WLAERQLVPLFDGLDEVPPEDFDACVTALNVFVREDRPRHAVVGCREAEYANHRQKLCLNDAIVLLPLTDQQVETYLAAADRSNLWPAIRSDHTLTETARSPLLLRIMTAAVGATSIAGWQFLSGPEAQARLF